LPGKINFSRCKGKILNYIKIINWFWDEVPYLKGYKGSYAALFFAIIDGINRNNWAADTPIAYDRLISKLIFSKQLYLDSREWLFQNDLIQFTPGRNGYQMAVFNIGVAVRNLTAAITADDVVAVRNPTADLTAAITSTSVVAVRNPTADLTHYKTYKHINLKPININVQFEIFWDLYDYKKNTNKAKALWLKLTDDERNLAINHIPTYKESTPDKTYRKHPATYLSNKSFNDEILKPNKNEQPVKHNFRKQADRKQAGFDYALDSILENAG